MNFLDFLKDYFFELNLNIVINYSRLYYYLYYFVKEMHLNFEDFENMYEYCSEIEIDEQLYKIICY